MARIKHGSASGYYAEIRGMWNWGIDGELREASRADERMWLHWVAGMYALGWYDAKGYAKVASGRTARHIWYLISDLGSYNIKYWAFCVINYWTHVVKPEPLSWRITTGISPHGFPHRVFPQGFPTGFPRAVQAARIDELRLTAYVKPMRCSWRPRTVVHSHYKIHVIGVHRHRHVGLRVEVGWGWWERAWKWVEVEVEVKVLMIVAEVFFLLSFRGGDRTMWWVRVQKWGVRWVNELE